MQKLTLLIALTLFLACGGDCPMQKELNATKAELEKMRSNDSTSAVAVSPLLMHTVFFKTKPDLTEEELTDFKTKMNDLSDIPGAINLRFGKPAETGDPRLSSDYDFVLHMGFASLNELEAYQKNATHIRAKESTKGYLTAPPVVFDYSLE